MLKESTSLQSEPDNNNLQAIITRNAGTQTGTASVFAMKDEYVRTKALVAIETPILKVGLAKEFSYFMPQVDTYSNMFLLYDTGKQELEKLHKTSSPIGKASLPTMVNMWEYPDVMTHIFKGEFKEAMFLFRDQYVKNVGLSDPLLDKLKYGGWALGITSAGITAYQIAKSDNKFEEAVHQSALFTGGLTGAIEAGTLAIAPCSVLAVWAPVCVAGASCAGGILGTELGEHLYQMAKDGKFSDLLSSKAHAAEPIKLTEPTTASPKFNLNSANFNIHQKTATTLNVDEFLERHTLPLFKNNPTSQKQTQYELLSQSTLDSFSNAWYSGPSNSPLKQLSKQLNDLNYLIRYQSPFLTQEGKNQLFKEQQQLHTKISQHTPNANEATLYLEVKNKLFALEQASTPLLTSKNIDPDKLTPNPKVTKIFQSKTSQQVKSAWEELKVSDAESDVPLSKADQSVRDYLKDHFVYHYGSHDFKSFDSAQARQERAFMIDNAGKAGIELGKIAYSFKNPELGDAFTFMGAAAQGISSAMLFMAATGAAAMGHFFGVISAIGTVISVFMRDDDNGMQEAFQEIFQQLKLLREELFELRKFMAQFKTDLFEYLNVYFGAVFSRFMYQEEIIRNRFSKTDYKLDHVIEGVDAVLDQLDDEIIYQVNAYYKGIRNASTLSSNKTEDYLTALKLRLDKSSSDYRSGVTACKGREKHGTVAAVDDMKAMLTTKRGQIPGYLTCYYQTTDWLSQKNLTMSLRRTINPVLWSRVAELYLFLRQLPSASEYDPNFVELMAIKKQGEEHNEFVDQHQANFQAILRSLFNDTQASIKKILNTFEYSETLKKLIKKYPVPPYLQAILSRHPDKGGNTPLRELSNEFMALEAAGLGKFTSQSGDIGGDGRWLFRDIGNGPFGVVSSMHLGLDPWPSNDLEKQFINKNFIQFEYTNLYRSDVVKLAFMTLADKWHGRDGTWTHGSRMTSGPPEYANPIRTEARNFVLQIRRNATNDIVRLLEKEVPKFQKNMADFLWHAYATLIIAGAPEELIHMFPMLELPEELSPWINLYRADANHEEVFRALPRPNNEIEVLKNFSIQLNNYSETLFNFIQNYTEILFRNRDIATVSTQLLALNQFYIKAALNGAKNPEEDQQKSLETAFNQSRQAINEQQVLLDNSIAIIHTGIATLADLPIQSEQPLAAWNQSLEEVITDRNDHFSPPFIREAHREYVDDSDPKRGPFRYGTDLQNLCSASTTLLSDLEVVLEKLSEKGSRPCKEALNTLSNPLLRPLYLAIQIRRDDIVELLLSYDAIVNEEDFAAIDANADDAISQRIMALLNFYRFMQSFDLSEKTESGRTLALIRKGIEELSDFTETDKDGVLFFGKTAAGKSTLVNYFLGVKYERTRNGLIAKKGYQEKTATGRSFTSETAFPEMFEFGNVLLGDMSGFGDTRGASYETAAGVITQKLSKLLKNMRLAVLVCEAPTFKTRSMEMIKIFNMYGRIIGQSHEKMNNVLILINEEVGNEKRSAEEIISLFKEAADGSEDLEENAQFFMRQLKAKNILVADPLTPATRQEFSDIVAKTKSTPMAKFNLASFHQHVEGFKKLLCHLEQYANTAINSHHSMINYVALEQLKNIVDIKAALESKTFLPTVDDNKNKHALKNREQAVEYDELNQYLEKQGNWKEQLLQTIVNPIITAIGALYSNQTERQIGSLQKIQQLAWYHQVAQTFLEHIETTGLMRLNDCPASSSQKEELTNSFGIPGAAAVEINMSHYRQDEEGFWFYQPPLEITRFYDGSMQTSCVYQWRNIFSVILPKTTLNANSNTERHALMPLCSELDNRIEFKFWKESTLRLSQTKKETHVAFIPSHSLAQFIHQGSNSFILGVTGGFTYQALKNAGFNEEKAQSTAYLFDMGLLYCLYGASSVLFHFFMLCLRHTPFNVSNIQTKKLSVLLMMSVSLYQTQQSSEKWVIEFVAQMLFSSLMNYSGQKIGTYVAQNLFNSKINDANPFFSSAAKNSVEIHDDQMMVYNN